MVFFRDLSGVLICGHFETYFLIIFSERSESGFWSGFVSAGGFVDPAGNDHHKLLLEASLENSSLQLTVQGSGMAEICPKFASRFGSKFAL